MTNNMQQTLLPEECASKIFEMNGAEIESAYAMEQWSKIMDQQLLPEKLGRDVGLRTSCIDFLNKGRINYSRV